jgi:two-component system chemotaxis response regulator CheY
LVRRTHIPLRQFAIGLTGSQGRAAINSDKRHGAGISQHRDHYAWSIRMALDPSMPILVVDDYQTMVRIIRNLLKQLGFENVDDASDGSAAISKMRDKKYGLVISDWNMEPMSGFELLQKVREETALSETPFIIVTAESKTENVVAAKKAGVSNYIVKPFNAQTLKTKIESVCAAA